MIVRTLLTALSVGSALNGAVAMAQESNSIEPIIVIGHRRHLAGEIVLTPETLRRAGVRNVSEAVAEALRRVELGDRPTITLNGVQSFDLAAIGNLPVEALQSIRADPADPSGPTLAITLKSAFTSLSAEGRTMNARGSLHSEELIGDGSGVNERHVRSGHVSILESEWSEWQALDLRSSFSALTLAPDRQTSLSVEHAATRRSIESADNSDRSLGLRVSSTIAAPGDATWLGAAHASMRRLGGEQPFDEAEIGVEGRIDGARLSVFSVPEIFGVGLALKGRYGATDLREHWGSEADLDSVFRLPTPRLFASEATATASISSRWIADRSPAISWELQDNLADDRWLLQLDLKALSMPNGGAGQPSHRDLVGAVEIDWNGDLQTARVYSTELLAQPTERSRSAALAVTYRFAEDTTLRGRLATEQRSNVLVRPSSAVDLWVSTLPDRVTETSTGLEIDASETLLAHLRRSELVLAFEHTGPFPGLHTGDVSLHVIASAHEAWGVDAALRDANLGVREIARAFDLEDADSGFAVLAEIASNDWRASASLSYSGLQHQIEPHPSLDIEFDWTLHLSPNVGLMVTGAAENVLNDVPGAGALDPTGVHGRQLMMSVRLAREVS
jgi:hypothetical protein